MLDGHKEKKMKRIKNMLISGTGLEASGEEDKEHVNVRRRA